MTLSFPVFTLFSWSVEKTHEDFHEMDITCNLLRWDLLSLTTSRGIMARAENESSQPQRPWEIYHLTHCILKRIVTITGVKGTPSIFKIFSQYKSPSNHLNTLDFSSQTEANGLLMNSCLNAIGESSHWSDGLCWWIKRWSRAYFAYWSASWN